MKLTALAFFLWAFAAQAQFSDEHLRTLAKISCGLSDAWTVDLIIGDEFNDELSFPVISLAFWHYKNEEDGTNFAPEISFFEKKYADDVRAYNWKNDALEKTELIETNSYIAVINYPLRDEAYNSLTAVLLEELKSYLAEHQSGL
jgi:hypothetical protein